MSVVGVLFLGADLANDFCVGNFLAYVRWDVVIVGNKESVGAQNSFFRAGGIGAYALAEESNFVGVGLVPDILVLWMFAELSVFKVFPCFYIQHCVRQWVRNSEGYLRIDNAGGEMRLAASISVVESLDPVQ